MYKHFTVFKKIRSENQLHKLLYNKDLISKKKSKENDYCNKQKTRNMWDRIYTLIRKNSKYFLENVYCFRILKDMKSKDINQDLKKNRQKREIKIIWQIVKFLAKELLK